MQSKSKRKEPVKMIKLSPRTHAKLTSVLGELIAESSKMKTYEDAVNAYLYSSVRVPPELVQQVQDYIDKNKQLCYSSPDEFFRETARKRLYGHSHVHKTS